MQRGFAKGIANLGYKKELETAVAEMSCQIQSRKSDPEARDGDKAGNAENDLFWSSSVRLVVATVLW